MEINSNPMWELPQNEEERKNIWSNEYPPRINEENYSHLFFPMMKVWLQLFFRSISGFMFLVIHAIIALVSFFVCENAGVAIFMNITSFLIPLVAMHHIKIKIKGTASDVSLTLLLRYYVFSATAMVLLWGMQLLFNNYDSLRIKMFWILFYISCPIVILLSLILASWPGTIREKLMRFFFIWPLKQDNVNATKPTKLIHILWIIRQLFQLIVISITMMLSQILINKVRENTENRDFNESLKYNAKTAFFVAGFCEEYFKFFLAASVPFIPKYENSKSAIIQVGIMACLGFSCVEDVMHATRSVDWLVAFRPLWFVLHFTMSYSIFCAITRQRDSILWIFEILGGFIFSIGLHGIYDYTIFIVEENDSLKWMIFLTLPFRLVIVYFGIIILMTTRYLPKEDEQPNETDVNAVEINSTTDVNAVEIDDIDL